MQTIRLGAKCMLQHCYSMALLLWTSWIIYKEEERMSTAQRTTQVKLVLTLTGACYICHFKGCLNGTQLKGNTLPHVHKLVAFLVFVPSSCSPRAGAWSKLNKGCSHRDTFFWFIPDLVVEPILLIPCICCLNLLCPSIPHVVLKSMLWVCFWVLPI